MKKAVLSAVAAWALVALIGCNHRADVEAVQPNLAELKPMQQSWRGVLPCADCEGIETALFLEKDGTWVMNSHYLGAAEKNTTFATYGTWARTADKLVLTDTGGEKYYYHAKGEALEMLDRDGNPITSSLNYTLEPIKASLPVTPMAMRGMYRSGVFTDCMTGLRLPVTPDAQLEQRYLSANAATNKPLLLNVEAHFTLKTNPDTGNIVKMLTADKAISFIPEKDCSK